jgi:predicted transcriptional regulator
MDRVRRASFRIEIRKIEPPFARDRDRELEWIVQTLGFSIPTNPNAQNPNLPQTNNMAVQLFKEIVAATEQGQGISSTELAEKVKMSRGAVINQLNNLQQSGLVVKQGRVYLSRSRSMVRTIQEVEEDIRRIFNRMEEIAKELDKEFGIEQ